MIGDDEAVVNVTYDRKNGNLKDPVSIDATDGDIRQWVTEAVRTGGVSEIGAVPDADFSDFVIERFEKPANPGPGERDHAIVYVRPKTPFGS